MTNPSGNEPALPIPDDTAASPMLGGDRKLALCETHNTPMLRDLFGQLACPDCAPHPKAHPGVTRQPLPGDPAWFTAGKQTPAAFINNVRRGLHPTGFPLSGKPEEKCGNCAHLIERYYGNTYFKCNLIRQTSGPGTDIRKGWAGCSQWEAIEAENG